MNTKILEYILAIAEEKNVSRAAERCYLSQPMLSLHLKKVEESYGVPLFARTPAGMELTQAGIIFVNNARSILHEQAQLEKQLADLRRSQTKTIHLLLDPSFYNFYIRSVQTPLQKNFPAYDIQVQTANAQQCCRALREGQADIAVFSWDGAMPEGVSARVLLEDQLVPVLSADRPLPEGGFRGLLFSGLPPLLHQVGTTVRAIEEKILVREGAFPPNILETNSFHLAMLYLNMVPCYSFLPQSLFLNNPQYKLQALPPQIPFNCLLAHRPELEDNARFQSILQQLGDAYLRFPSQSESSHSVRPSPLPPCV